MSHTLSIKGLFVERQGRPLFEPFNLKAQSGEWIMLRGPNGTGKSSLLASLMGFVEPSDGIAEIDHENLTNNIKKISYFTDKYKFNKRNKLFRELDFLRTLQQNQTHPSIDEIASINRLYPAEYYSSGQIQRSLLAGILDFDRPVWLLDEPENSLDMDGTSHLCRVCLEHTQKHNGILLWASHRPDILGTSEVTLG